MTINLSAELEAAVASKAQRLGTTPAAVVEQALQAQLLVGASTDSRTANNGAHEKLQRVLAIARPCGVALSNEALSSEGLYD